MSNKIVIDQYLMKNTTFKVAEIISDEQLIINAGTNQGIRKGYKFLIYSLGEEIFDPDTNESLGQLETSKGVGEVIHVQEKMSILRSTKRHRPPAKKTITEKSHDPYRINHLAAFYRFDNDCTITTIEESEPEILPFSNPQIGDLAKYIS